jgi:hypothetical protein
MWSSISEKNGVSYSLKADCVYEMTFLFPTVVNPHVVNREVPFFPDCGVALGVVWLQPAIARVSITCSSAQGYLPGS